MFISIIIPVYNVDMYLAACLDSVLGQTYPHFEVICVNDGSTDGSAEILAEYSGKYAQIRVITQENNGLSGARNTGIRAAEGDYLFFLDSDDWIEPNALQVLAEKHQGEDLVCFNGRRYFEDGRAEISDKGITDINLSGWDYYNKYALVARNFHFVCSVLRIYKRDFLLQHQLFFHEGIYHEDNLFTPIVCYYAQSVKVIPDCLYVYRIREGSITQDSTLSNNMKRTFDIVTVANQLATFFIPKNEIDRSVVYREIAGEYFKGFMKDTIFLSGNNDRLLKSTIIHNNFRIVCTYPRHRRLYYLLNLGTPIFRKYIDFEKAIKRFRYGHSR